VTEIALAAHGRGACGRAVSRSFHEYFQSAGKAVKSGHSCAAVTGYEPAPRPFPGAGKANRIQFGEGAGEVRGAKVTRSEPSFSKESGAFRPLFGIEALRPLALSRDARTLESEYLPWGSHAFSANFARAESRKLHRKNEA
jgi:hypothetical protein